MNFVLLTNIEFKKIRRCGIFFILLAAAVLLWLPAVFHADINFKTQADLGITPENNFMIQGFLGMAWFLFPACMAVCTVLLHQIERQNNGMRRMRSLPVHAAQWCLAKFFVFLCLAAVQILLSAGIYFISAAAVSRMQHYDFMLAPPFVFKEAGLIFLAAVPMLSVFWLVSVFFRTPIFSIGICFASIVPSVLIINTKAWFLYPMSYPFYLITNEYARLCSSMTPEPLPYGRLAAAAVFITLFCLTVSCLHFGHTERSSK